MAGNAFIWNPSARCKKQIHWATNGAYECMETALPVHPEVLFATNPARTCYERNRSDTVWEVMMSSNLLPEAITKGAGWRKCPYEFRDSVIEAPDCP